MRVEESEDPADHLGVPRDAGHVIAVLDLDVFVLIGLVGDALIADHLTRVAAESVEENDQWRRLRGVVACRDEERVLDFNGNSRS